MLSEVEACVDIQVDTKVQRTIKTIQLWQYS